MAVGKPAAIMSNNFLTPSNVELEYLLPTMYVQKEELHNSSAVSCFYLLKQLLPQQ